MGRVVFGSIGFLLTMAAWGLVGGWIWAVPATLWATNVAVMLWLYQIEKEVAMVKAGCGECRELFDSAQEMVDHMFATGHCLPEELMDEEVTEEDREHLAKVVAAIMENPEIGTPVGGSEEKH